MRFQYIISFLIIVCIGCIANLSFEIYQECHADASDHVSETFEYYYNDPYNEGKKSMSDTSTRVHDTHAAKKALHAIAEEQAKAAESASISSIQKKPDYPQEPDTKLGSYTQLINRSFTLPKDYVPDDLVVPDVRFSFSGICDKRKLRKKAAKALEELFAAAEEDDIYLYGLSGYRSYSRQSEIYDHNLATKGAKYTNQYSAMPGTSEHQSGLAIDLTSESADLQLVESFAETDEGRWIGKHAWEYGWIVRYDKNMSDITGYAYEPWHIRYVGKDLAKILHQNNLCLEEYYGCD